MNKTQSLHTIRFNANQILVESAAKTATLNNYDYLFNFVKRLDIIASCIQDIGPDFESESVANTVANSIHKAMVKLIPAYGLGDFDWDGVGEDLTRLVHGAWVVLRDCDEDGLAQGICDRHNLFTTMCEIQERLDEEWLEMLAND